MATEHGKSNNNRESSGPEENNAGFSVNWYGVDEKVKLIRKISGF